MKAKSNTKPRSHEVVKGKVGFDSGFSYGISLSLCGFVLALGVGVLS